MIRKLKIMMKNFKYEFGKEGGRGVLLKQCPYFNLDF